MSEVAATPLPRVLIVDDSRIVRATLIKHLKGYYEFCEAADGEAGWAALTGDAAVQIVLTDLSMPKLDGYGLIERIRASDETRIKRVPVVLISGEEDEASRNKAKELGASDFITKGIGTPELLSRIASLVKLAQTENALTESRESQVKHPETGVFSAAFVAEQAQQVMALAQRHRQSAGALVVALDNQDAIKAKYGEAVLGQISQRFGQLLASKIRKEDCLGHFDARSFIVLSPATPDMGCMVFAERLREAVESLAVTLGGQRVVLTVSIGVSDVPTDAVQGAQQWMEIAAQRMTIAAGSGGNRVVGYGNDVLQSASLPTIEGALVMIKSGRQQELSAHAGALALLVLPILQMANQELKLGIPVAEIEKRLLDRARKEIEA